MVVQEWFVEEVLRHERALTRYLRRRIHDDDELIDLRQEVYTRLFDMAKRDGAPPANTLALAYTIARNLLIDRSRHATVIPIDLATDFAFDALVVDPALVERVDALTPERYATGREEVRRFQLGLRNLPDRCREVVTLRKVDGLSQRDCARRLGITEDTVERQIRYGMRALADFMLGGDGRIQRPAKGHRKAFRR